MTRFKTKADMVAAWRSENPELHKDFADAKYVPHIYKGGWVIRGFGYSVERIGVNVTAENAGDPLGV